MDVPLHRGRHVFYRGAPPPPRVAGLRRIWAIARCPAHCWHQMPGTEPEPRYYCCECPSRRPWRGANCAACATLRPDLREDLPTW